MALGTLVLIIVFLTFKDNGQNTEAKHIKPIREVAPQDYELSQPYIQETFEEPIFVDNTVPDKKQDTKQKRKEKLPKPSQISKYNEVEDFDEELLSNTISSSTQYFRDEFYQNIDKEVMNKQFHNPTGNETDDLIEQFEIVIDYSLGINIQNEKRKKLIEQQASLYKKGKILDEKLERGLITEIEYDKQEEINYESNLRKMADHLNDNEFEAMFEHGKDEIEGSFSRLKSMGDQM